MKDFFKLNKELQSQKSLLNNRLGKLLQENGYEKYFAWFNWNEDAVTIIWDDEKLPMKMLNELEKEFGRINHIQILKNPISSKIRVVFVKEMSE